MYEFFTTTNLGIALTIVGQVLLIVVPLLVALAFLLYYDRKVWAAVQMRRGPNVVGAFGLLQSFADFLKYVLKEIVVPAGADKFVFFLAPMLSFVLAMVAWAVIPFNDRWVLADVNVAILFVFAVSSLEVYGVIMGGWASNSKYPFLGSLRSAAQMISYEVSIGLIIIGVIISTGSMNFGEIVRAQDGAGLFSWYWLPHFPMVFLFLISAMAETNRPPFDLPEAESELVAGYQVEYSSTPFLLFMIGEYVAIVLMCALVTLLFFGGWLSPIEALPDGALWFILKMFFFFSIFAMVKAITPRYRYDQLMRIGWKVFLPISLAWVVIVAFLAQYGVGGNFWARWDRADETAMIQTMTEGDIALASAVTWTTDMPRQEANQ
ncbi:MAG: NADH-quinone oxidoreductase subunit NuoH [Pseudomonadota bacterium]|nr:NADH-quinone oxidoreductase subunit NuoH [Pseudomonadota bacterium]